MRILFPCLLLCAGLIGPAMPAFSQEPADAGSDPLRWLSDPAFRLLAGQAGGGRSYALLAIPPDVRPSCYEWLRHNVKPVPDQALECRLLSWLARDLQRPEAEIQKADDLVLQSAPDLPEGWLNRAASYASASNKEPAKSAWALDTFAQALRRVDFASPDWRATLAGIELDDWSQRAAEAGRLSLFADALSDALRASPREGARLDAAGFVRAILQSKAWLSDPTAQERLLDAIAEAQPHLVLGDALGFIEMARTFESRSQRGLATRLARMLALATVPQEIALPEDVSRSGFALQWSTAHPPPVLPVNPTPLQRAEYALASARHEAQAGDAADLRRGWVILQLSWEDTMPRYLPMTQARAILRMAVGDDTAAFAAAARDVAATQPWNESLISHALVASAITDTMAGDHLSLASSFDAAARFRLALRLYAFAPRDHLPHAELAPWLMDGVAALLPQGAAVDPLERAQYSTVLQTLDAFERAGDVPHIHELLARCLARPPRAMDADHWKQLSVAVLRHGAPAQVSGFAGVWADSIAGSDEALHLPAVAAAAARGRVANGGGYAGLALRIWDRKFAARQERTMEDAMAASRVSEALLACEDLDGFSEFTRSLEASPGSNSYSTFARMTRELVTLRELLSGDTHHPPAVDAWVQPLPGEGSPARVHWRFVLPELDELSPRVPPIRIRVLVGGRDAAPNMSAEESPEGRWWTAGTPLPLLRRLAGKYELLVSAGENPRQLREVARVAAASESGSVEVRALPPAGCIGVRLLGKDLALAAPPDARLYSLRAPLFATGAEPDASGRDPAFGPRIGDHPSPATWTRLDDERWGRLIGPPIAIEDGTEYLLTQFAPPPITDEKVLPVQLILLDERQRPLGPVPLVSVGFHDGPRLAANYTNHLASTQRFRASDWGWAEDVVRLREKTLARAEQTLPARYMAFVSRSTGEGVVPLLQLRRYHEPVGGTGSSAVSNPDLVQMPELNGEYVASVGFRVRSWHITMGPQRAIFGGEGRLAGFDVARIPWKPIMQAQSHLLQGNEWPMCFASERALIVEPSWSGDRRLGVRFVPFGKEGENYEACERRDLPLRTYSRGELSINHDGALMMLASENREKPAPQAAWLFPDGRCSVCPLPRPPLRGSSGLEVAWWGPQADRFTLHEDGLLFEMELTDELRLVNSCPGSPDDMPEGATPPKSKKLPQWRLERPDILTEHDTTTGVMVRRFHLPQPCEAKPMSFSETSPVFLYTTEHDIIRVSPPPRKFNTAR